MYRKIVWCYVLVLTLLDISLNTKLTAQGKSHDVTVHDSLIEGISFQEWGKDGEGDNAVGLPGGSASAAEALRLEPASLRFGRSALGAAHALTVTLTNTANTTVHLASVAGTTPDFHASFFESKTLPPNGNTTFSVVYLGRREGAVAAHLYIHTSLGVHKYPVSAEGVASEYGLWPLVGLRVPQNATLDPLLTIYNPTDKYIQIREVYSSGSWVGLRLPGGGGAAPKDAWRVPPHSERPLVRLQVRLPQPPHPHLSLHQPHQHAEQPGPLTAYIRIKGDGVGYGSGLVVGVEAWAAAAGAFLLPPQLRLRARGSRDPPHTWDISAGNSGDTPIRVEAAVWGARCGPIPVELTHPSEPHNGQAERATHNGLKSEGAHVTVLRQQLDPHQEPQNTLQLTLDYARLWASHYLASATSTSAASVGLWCGGWLRLGSACAPYTLRLLPGTLAVLPSELQVVTANKEEAGREREVRVRNEFPVPLRVSAVEYGPDVHKHFHTVEMAPLLVEPGQTAVVARLRLKEPDAPAQLDSLIHIHTNLTTYTAPILLHRGLVELEWEWPNSSDGHLRVGSVGTSSTRRVGARVHNPTPRALCISSHRVRLPGAQLTIDTQESEWPNSSDGHLRVGSVGTSSTRRVGARVHNPTPRALCISSHRVRLPGAQLTIDTQSCIQPGGWARAWLTVVAPARPGALTGSVHVGTQHAAVRAYVTLHARAGTLHAHPLALEPAAPYAWSTSPLELESTMALSMRVVNVSQPHPDPAVTFVPSGSGWVSGGRQVVGAVVVAPEARCTPNCYTGLDLDSPEGQAWLQRGPGADEEDTSWLLADVELLATRREMFLRQAASVANVSLLLHTTEVVGIPVTGSVRAHWPWLRVRSADSAPPVDGVLCGMGGSTALRLRVRNPSPVPLLLHAALTEQQLQTNEDHHHPQDAAGISAFCRLHACAWSARSFHVSGWRALSGDVVPYSGNTNWTTAVLMSPQAEMELTVTVAPVVAAPIAVYLYLRNNLTIAEIIPIWGRGAYPSFELGGRRPGSTAPVLFEVSSCSDAEGGGVVRRSVRVRNTGAVPVRLRDWALAGQPCQQRGFRLQPCAPLTLAPNETRTLRLAFAPDYTQATVHAKLTVNTDLGTHEFILTAHAPAKLLKACQPHAPKPPFEPAMRAAGTMLALAALALVIAAAALDAERELRLARAARAPPPPAARAPLDLRAVSAPPPPPAPPRRAVPPPPPRRRRAPRRPPPLDPHAERRAFERWRAEVLRRADDDDDERSSEEDIVEAECPPPMETAPLVDRDRSPSPSPPDDAMRRSSDDDAPSLESSVGSSDSSPGSELGRECDECEDTDPEPSPRSSPAETARTRRETSRADAACTPRARREPGEAPRRSGRATDVTSRPPPARPHARREKTARRRGGERANGTPPLSSPPTVPEPRAPAAVRWGATWSSVVAAGGGGGAGAGAPLAAPLPPIGSDVRRAPRVLATQDAQRVAADNSLFYFNGDQPGTSAGVGGVGGVGAGPSAAAAGGAEGYSWRPEPPRDRPAYPPPHHDYQGDFDDNPGLGGNYASPWTTGGAWAWGGALVRPPPGFHGPPPPPPRAYDPFRSLAALWAPGALDWRPEEPAPQAPPPPQAPQPPPQHHLGPQVHHAPQAPQDPRERERNDE